MFLTYILRGCREAEEGIQVIKLLTIGLLVLFTVVGLMAQDVQVATTIAFIEGPAADGEGNVFFTDQANNRIMKLSSDGKLSTYRHDERSITLVIGRMHLQAV